MLDGGQHPDLGCVPILKKESDQSALLRACVRCTRFFLGTDSAPHLMWRIFQEQRIGKYASCCANGIFSAPVALESYLEAFSIMGEMDRFPEFCERGRKHYGLSPNKGEIVLVRAEERSMGVRRREGPRRAPKRSIVADGWVMEGDKRSKPLVVHFQLRPDPLAK